MNSVNIEQLADVFCHRLIKRLQQMDYPCNIHGDDDEDSIITTSNATFDKQIKETE